MPRTKLTPAQIAAFVPTSRGPFTFPAPYNTRAWRVTDATDGTIWYVGYSYWRNMNYHVNDSVIKIFIGTQGSAGPILFHFDKTTQALTKVGSIFPVGSPWRNWPGEGWYWNNRNQDWLYIGDRDFWYRYNVVNGTQQLFISAVGMWGADREVLQLHSNYDDSKHVFTVRVKSTSVILGAGYYDETAGTTRFYAEPGMNEAHVDQSGRFTVLQMNNGDMKVYDNTTGTLILNEPEGARALGHMDTGWEFVVGGSNFAVPLNLNSSILWTFNPITYQGIQHHNQSLAIDQLQHYAVAGSYSKTPETQFVYGSGANSSTYENELTVVRLDGTNNRQLVVCPLMSDLNATGGGIDYAKYPKGNVDVTGRYFLWTTNLGGSRLDAFLVEAPKELLL